MDLLEQLRQAIKDSGVPQIAIAVASGLTSSIITHFLNDDRKIRLDTACRLATAIGYELRLHKVRKPTTSGMRLQPGTINRNRQKMMGIAGTIGFEGRHRPHQHAYNMLCLDCKHTYLTDGCNVRQCKCPKEAKHVS